MGNTWKKIDFPYAITADTILEFDFKSGTQGEVHSIGFDTNLAKSSNYAFPTLRHADLGYSDLRQLRRVAAGLQALHDPHRAALHGHVRLPALRQRPRRAALRTGESYFSNVTVYDPPPTPAEIVVTGSALNIADGDATPEAADGTDFGSVASGQPGVERTYTVRNEGGAALTLGAPSVPSRLSRSSRA